jgi:peptidoglycan-associated lipoprotein
MIKKLAYSSAIAALLVFSGCSTKEPTIDATANSNTSGTGSQTDMSGQNSAGDNAAVIAPVTNASSTDISANGSDNGSGKMASILFDFNKYDIRDDMQGTLKTDSVLVKGKTFKLEGNCDEFGSDEYNFALGLKRANAVKSALVAEGINADSISMVSLGEGNPVCLEKTQECWAKNRRVDFKLP